jgi:hypothetical protein
LYFSTITNQLFTYFEEDCCVQSECWTFATKGLATIGQDELLVTLERLPEEDTFPRDIFRLFTFVYDNASKGIRSQNILYLSQLIYQK